MQRKTQAWEHAIGGNRAATAAKGERLPEMPGAGGWDPACMVTLIVAYYWVGNAKVMFFPNYMITVQKQRSNFLAVKLRLSGMGFTYSLLFPAKLRVVTTNTTRFFVTPEEAWHWIENSDDCADCLMRLESAGEDTLRRNRRGQ
ncbi:hypothetical protein NDU88_002281 [Pleurodeles waltl]|uniref:Uncharacterized protein n=1 Tax=Pleurodeles waltl TaxID=8319 RepID=A0AAV7M1Y1_PLEWA|nr:hypothetical protein NDU88_002281 [Pleurodeles waltl]